MKQVVTLFALLSATCTLAFAAEPKPLMTTAGKELVSEEFSSETVPATFHTLKTPDSFSVVEGALQMITQPGQQNATHGAFMVKAHDLNVAFSVKFVKTGTLYVGIDGYKEAFKGNTHLARFSLSPQQIAWDQHRDGPESKRAVGEAMKAARAAKQLLPKPTAEQLADPNFFRIEELATKSIECAVGEWHQVLLEVNGNDLVAQVDGQTLITTATESGAMKNRIGIGMTGRGTVLIDNVRIWENTRRADWEAVKAKLSAKENSAAR